MEVMSRYLTLMAPRRKEMPSEKEYNSSRRTGTRSQVQDGVTPSIRAKMKMTARLISTLITAVRVAETTTMYLGKQTLRMRSPRPTMAWIPWLVLSVKKLQKVVPTNRYTG